MQTKKAQTKPQVQVPKLTDRERRVALNTAIALGINQLSCDVKDIETQLRPMKQKIAYLRSVIAPPPKPKAKAKPAKKKSPSGAQIKKAAQALKAELESPAFGAKLKDAVANRDAIDVTPEKVQA